MPRSVVEARRLALTAESAETTPSINFATYDEKPKPPLPPPARLAIVKALSGRGPVFIREVVRRVDRGVQAVHRDAISLVTRASSN